MKKFPKTLAASPGMISTLDPSMLVVCFKKPMKQPDVQTLAAGLKLVLFTLQKPDDKARWMQVNHTDTRFWLKTDDGKPIDDARLADIEKRLGDQLAWIGPVYENSTKKGGENCFCPIPNVALIPKTKNLNIASLARANGFTLDETRSKYLRNFYYVQIPQGSKLGTAFDLKAKLAPDGGDVFFENMPMLRPVTAVTPNDPLWANQWNMVQINAPAGWDSSQGSPGVVVCILDEGCDLSHPDLQFAGPGLNLGTMDPNGSPTGPHGTACAGIAAATLNNNAGVAGVAGKCLILPVAFYYWTDVECAIGINFATMNGANVISMSFGVYDGWGWDYSIIDPEIQNAFDNNVVLVAASGNENDGYTNRYPGRHPLVIAVGGSSTDDNRKSPNSPDGEYWWGANFGEEYYNGVLTGLSVVAPCVLCPTTDIQGPNEGYSTDDYLLNFNGTSSATPHVAGLAALLKSQNPARTNIQIREIIERSAAKVGNLPYAEKAGFSNGTRNQEMGYGRIDAQAALSQSKGGNCEDLKKGAAADLLQIAADMFNHVKNQGNSVEFEVFVSAGNSAQGCGAMRVNPCFYLHWGNDRGDVLETESFEMLVLSVCNPFANVEFRGVSVSGIEVSHSDGTPVELLPNKTPAVRLVPSKLIHLGNIAPCSCSHIELALKTTGAAEGPYRVKLNCCITEMQLQSVESEAASFDIALMNV